MNKTVLITGASKGLGAAIAKKFASENYNLILTFLKSEQEIKSLKLELQKEYNVKVEIEKLDVTDEKEVKKLFKKIENLDVLINNAAYNNDTLWNEKSALEFQKILSTNIIGPYLMIKNAYPLLKNVHGNIINIASTNGIDTMYPESLDYDASKAGLINMTKNLVKVLSPEVRINAIAPGWIETHNTLDINPEFKKEEVKKIVLKRFAIPEEIAELVYFVASDKASYMNGSIVRIDGGKNDEF